MSSRKATIFEHVLGSVIILGGLSGMIWADSRKPAVVLEMQIQQHRLEERRACDLSLAQANRRIARLRGAITHMRYAVQRVNVRGPEAINEGLIEIHATATNAIAQDDAAEIPEIAK